MNEVRGESLMVGARSIYCEVQRSLIKERPKRQSQKEEKGEERKGRKERIREGIRRFLQCDASGRWSGTCCRDRALAGRVQTRGS